MILTTCKYIDLVGNRCSRVTDGKCNDLQDCEFKYIAGLKAENAKLKSCLQEIKAIAERQLLVTNIRTYQMVYYADFSEYRNEILQKITKAEEE